MTIRAAIERAFAEIKDGGNGEVSLAEAWKGAISELADPSDIEDFDGLEKKLRSALTNVKMQRLTIGRG